MMVRWVACFQGSDGIGSGNKLAGGDKARDGASRFSTHGEHFRDIMNISVAYLKRTSNYSASDAGVGEYRKITFCAAFCVIGFVSSLSRE